MQTVDQILALFTGPSNQHSLADAADILTLGNSGVDGFGRRLFNEEHAKGDKMWGTRVNRILHPEAAESLWVLRVNEGPSSSCKRGREEGRGGSESRKSAKFVFCN